MPYVFWHSILAFYLIFYSDVLFWHSIWNLVWHPIWHPFWHLFWHSRTWARGPAVPTEICCSRFNSDSAHWDLEIEVWQCPHWDLALSAHWDLGLAVEQGGRRREEATLIKYLHLTGGNKHMPLTCPTNQASKLWKPLYICLCLKQQNGRLTEKLLHSGAGAVPSFFPRNLEKEIYFAGLDV